MESSWSTQALETLRQARTRVRQGFAQDGEGFDSKAAWCNALETLREYVTCEDVAAALRASIVGTQFILQKFAQRPQSNQGSQGGEPG